MLGLHQDAFWGSDEDGGSQEGQDPVFAPCEGPTALGRTRVCVSRLAAAFLAAGEQAVGESTRGLQLVIRQLLKRSEE